MQKYFNLLLELLRPEDDDFVMEEKKKLSATAKKMEEKWDKSLIYIWSLWRFIEWKDFTWWFLSYMRYHKWQKHFKK